MENILYQSNEKIVNNNNNNNNFTILRTPTQWTFPVLLETKPISHQKIFALTVSNSFFSFNLIRFSPSQWNKRLLAKARLSASELLPHLFHSNCWEIYCTNIKITILNWLQNFTYSAPSVTCSLRCIWPQLRVPQQKIKTTAAQKFEKYFYH